MRILIVNNFYRSGSPSGEGRVFEAEKTLLQSRGHEVVEFARHSDEISAKGTLGVIQAALGTPWNPWMASAMRREIEHFKPEIVHIHNTFPLISPAIYYAIGKGPAKILTLHNYRLICPAAIPMRLGQICTKCLDEHSVIPSLMHGCYRGSRFATVPLAACIALHRSIGTWTKKVNAFIALSDFQRDLMVKSGLPDKRVHVKPNFFSGNPDISPWADREPYIVFVGRLTSEKGVETLVRAWKLWGEHAPELRIVGDGPLFNMLKQLSAQLPIRFLGQMSSDMVHAQIAKAKLLVLPSECFETFGLVVVEAFAFGTPAAVSNIGPLPSIVKHGKNGVVFMPADPDNLLHTIRTAWETPGMLGRLGLVARSDFEAKYTGEANYTMMMTIYQRAMEDANNG